MDKTIKISAHAHYTLQKLAGAVSGKRGRFTSIKAVISALAAGADVETVTTTVNERTGLMRLGKLKKMKAEMARMEREINNMMGK